jgi:hypothetical protein
MATFLKIFIVVLSVVLLARGFVAWLRPDVMPGFSFLPGDIKEDRVTVARTGGRACTITSPS